MAESSTCEARTPVLTPTQTMKKLKNLTITISLPLNNLDLCFEQLRHLRTMTYSSCMESEAKYDLREQIEKAEKRLSNMNLSH
ncbi:hypothetical protein UH38_13050 [Aliterella atlantica CENA595]|uniref:Uncharacterized protein n=1 Tax=Aliterella atlantica CENA595 TaxID=1618023 RepID=A0A0D8ZR05_9CYAN|nr:hypothetical protein UH38_13050 [Aliterella atlantica CENA595]